MLENVYVVKFWENSIFYGNILRKTSENFRPVQTNRDVSYNFSANFKENKQKLFEKFWADFGKFSKKL